MLNRSMWMVEQTDFLFSICAAVILFSLSASGKEAEKTELPGVTPEEAYLGTHGFAFPKAKTITGNDPASLETIVANYVIGELNYSLSKAKTDNQFLQTVFGVESSAESDSQGQNSLSRLSAQFAAVDSKNPYLRLNALNPREEKTHRKSYILLFDVDHSRYKTGVLFFSIIDPQQNKAGHIETELALGGIFLSF